MLRTRQMSTHFYTYIFYIAEQNSEQIRVFLSLLSQTLHCECFTSMLLSVRQCQKYISDDEAILKKKYHKPCKQQQFDWWQSSDSTHKVIRQVSYVAQGTVIWWVPGFSLLLFTSSSTQRTINISSERPVYLLCVS